MGKTFAEKLLGIKVGKDVITGEIVIAKPDYVMSHDNTAAISKTFKSFGVTKSVIPEKTVIILDHCVPAADHKHATNHKVIREFVKEQGIKHFFDINHGICHQVLPENGFAMPGTLILGSDSHTNTYGAFGSFSAGIGRSEMASLYALGELWLMVPETIKIVLNGNFKKGVYAKDLILHIIGEIGADGALYKSVEFHGDGAKNLSISERMTIANMSAEMGAKNGIFYPDEKVDNFLSKIAKSKYEKVWADDDASYEAVLEYDLSKIEPKVAKPHTVDNVVPIKDVKGTSFDQALLGTCTNGRLDDLEIAANILKGKKVHDSVRLLVFPASSDVYKAAMNNGTLKTLAESGAVIMNSGCGPCLGAHEGALAPGEVCLSTANRNFKGRMGTPEAEVYLASPATVAVSSISGKIADPRTI